MILKPVRVKQSVRIAMIFKFIIIDFYPGLFHTSPGF